MAIKSPNLFGLVGRGRMATLIASMLQSELNAKVLMVHSQSTDEDWNALERADIIIDFSTAAAIERVCATACRFKKPCLVGTTGWETESERLKAMVKKAQIAFLHSSNFSWGIYALRALMQRIFSLRTPLGIQSISLHEIHHQNKIDTPSGTAKDLAEEAKSLFGFDHIEISSQRTGDVIGQHRLILSGDDETIELAHFAKNRLGFAKGAIGASRWLFAQQPGWFTMRDMADQIVAEGIGLPPLNPS